MGGGKLWRSRRGAGQHRRLPRVAKGGHSVAEPLLARNARLTQEASQQSDADVAFVAVRNNDRDVFLPHLRMAPLHTARQTRECANCARVRSASPGQGGSR